MQIYEEYRLIHESCLKEVIDSVGMSVKLLKKVELPEVIDTEGKKRRSNQLRDTSKLIVINKTEWYRPDTDIPAIVELTVNLDNTGHGRKVTHSGTMTVAETIFKLIQVESDLLLYNGEHFKIISFSSYGSFLGKDSGKTLTVRSI